MFDPFGNEKLYEDQEKAREIEDLNERLAWLENRLRLEKIAKERQKDSEVIQSLLKTAEMWRDMIPYSDQKTVFDILPEEINRTKDLLLFEEIREEVSKLDGDQAKKFYLIECKTDFRYTERLLFFNEKNYMKFLDDFIKEIKNGKMKAEQSTGFGLQWTDKTEMSELINALALSKRITKEGTPITKKALKEVFEKLFNTDLSNIDKLLNAKAQTAKQAVDKEHFMNELSELNKSHFTAILGKTPNK
jgi:hypothetical protein